MRRISLSIGSLLVCSCFAVACGKSDAPPPPAAPKAAPTDTVSPPPAPPPSNEPSPGEPGLQGRLADEAAHRVAGDLTVEKAFAALQAAGVTVEDPKQYLAGTVKAVFCRGGHAAGGGISVAVCEYSDAASAKAGMEYSLDKFKSVGGRHLTVNKNLMLTVTVTSADPKIDAVAAQAAEAFGKL